MAATWPVIVRTGDRLLHLQTVNLSAHGVKVGLDAALPPVGASAHLRLAPPDEHERPVRAARGEPGAKSLDVPPMDVEAIVWRADDDGSAFFFVGTSYAE